MLPCLTLLCAACQCPVFRGALLGIGATVLGVLLGGAPDYLAGTIKLPAVLTEPGLLVSCAVQRGRLFICCIKQICVALSLRFSFATHTPNQRSHAC